MRASLPASNLKFAESSKSSGDGKIQSVERALTILEVMSSARRELTLSEISEKTGLNASTCHHIVATLVERNYVSKAVRRGSYRLGSQILVLAAGVNEQVDLLQQAGRALDDLNEVTSETVHFAVLQGGELVTLLKRDARHAVRVDAGTVGKSNACHATATGKALLAWLPDNEVVRFVEARGLKAFTPKTLRSLDALRAELAEVRRNGFAVDNEEFQPHVVCVGAPITDASGAVIASISASTPIMRADGHHLDRLTQEVMKACQKLSLGQLRRMERP